MANFLDSWRAGGRGNGGYTLGSRSASEVPLILQLITGQVANGFEIKNALGTTIFSVSPVGDVTYTGSEVVSSALTVTGATHLQSTLAVDGVSTINGAMIINGEITFGASGRFVNGINVAGDSTIEGTTTIHSLFVEGDLTLESGYLRSRYSANLYLYPSPSTITVVGATNATSHTLNTNSDMFINGKLEVDGVIYADGGLGLGDDDYLYFGDSNDVGIAWNTAQTVDGWYFGTSDAQNTLIIAELGDKAYDFAHGAQTNPTVFIQSATQSATQWGSLAHDQTDFVITSGAGFVKLAGATGASVPLSTAVTGNAALWTTMTPTATSGVFTSYAQYVQNVDNAVVTANDHTDYGIYCTTTKAGADTSVATTTLYGIYSTASNTGSGAFGTKNTYAGYFTATGDTAGTATAYGIYATATGADTNWAGYFSGNVGLGDNDYLYFGDSNDVGIGWNTAQTVDGWYFGTATGQNTMIIAEIGDIAYDFAHGAQTNPTLFIQSATQSATEFAKLNAGVLTFGLGIATVAGQYSIGRNADATNVMQLEVPTGASYEFSVNDTAIATLGTTGNLGLTGQITGVTAAGASLDIVPTTGKYVRIGDAGTTSQSFDTNDDLFVSGRLEVDGLSYFDQRAQFSGNGVLFTANSYIAFTTVDDASSGIYNQSNNVNFWLGTGNKRSIVFSDGTARGSNFDHAAQSQPTLFLHSVTNPEVDNRQFGNWYVANAGDGYNTYHTTGTGGHRFGFEALAANATTTFTANPTTDLGIVFTVNTGTLTGTTGVPGANQFKIDSTLALTLASIVTNYNLIAGTGVTAHVYGSTVVFEANATGTAANAYVTTETTDTDNVYSFGGAVMSGGRAFSGLFDLQPGQATIVASTPIFGMKDTDCTDYLTDTSAQIYAQATDTGSGTEDVDVYFQQQTAGVMSTYLQADADGDVIFTPIVNQALRVTATDTRTTGATSYGTYITETSIAIVTGTSQNLYGGYFATSKTGADTSVDTTTIYSVYGSAVNTGSTNAGTKNTYGGYFSATGDTAGTSTAYGIYATASGANTNYGVYSSAIIPLYLSQTAGTTNVPTAFTLISGAHTGMTQATEAIGVNFNLSATKTWATGAGPLATQREFVVQAPTYSGDVAGALTITNAYTAYITGNPTAGTNLTITNAYALGVAGNIIQTATISSTVAGAALTYSTSGSPTTTVGMAVTLSAGATPTILSQAMGFENLVANTSATFTTDDDTYGLRPNGNRGAGGIARGTTIGINTGLQGSATKGNRNIGMFGSATVGKASATNVGVAGFGANSSVTAPVQIGGYFALSGSATVTLGTSAALIADNYAATSDIFSARDANVAVFTIANGGGISIGETIAGVITHTARTSDVATSNLTITAQDAWQNATAATNDDGGDLILRAGTGNLIDTENDGTGGSISLQPGKGGSASGPGTIDFYNNCIDLNLYLSMAIDGSTGSAKFVTPDGTTDYFFGYQSGPTWYGSAVIENVTSQVNYLQLTGAVTTASPILSAQGSDTNINITLTPKGTGVVDSSGSSIRIKRSVANVSSPPTDAELDATFGDPTVVGSGFIGILDDNDAGTASWIVWTTGTADEWFYAAGTKAV